MKVEQQGSYQRLATWFDKQKSLGMNGIVVTFPGCGFSHRAEVYAKNKKDVAMILKEGEPLLSFNIIILSFISNGLSIKVVDDYLKMATSEQKIIVAIDDVSFLESESFKTSYLAGHVYDFLWFGAFDENEMMGVAKDMGDFEGDLTSLYKLSGGISRLVKYLCKRSENRDLKDLVTDPGLQSICRPMLEVIKKSSLVDLERLEIAKRGEVKSMILRKLQKEMGMVINIKVGKDLALLEDGVTGEKLARVEKEILEKMLELDGYLSREKVAEIKWGKEDFSDFSDQAINKTMRRLSSKMKKYKIETIWKTGYKLVKK